MVTEPGWIGSSNAINTVAGVTPSLSGAGVTDEIRGGRESCRIAIVSGESVEPDPSAAASEMLFSTLGLRVTDKANAPLSLAVSVTAVGPPVAVTTMV
jgi:hypothetical protein